MADEYYPEDESTVTKLKNHFIRHKTAYISCGVGLVVGAGVTWLVMRKPKTIINNVIEQVHVGDNGTNIIAETVVHLTSRAHPGFTIEDTRNGVFYPSKAVARKMLNLSQSALESLISDGTLINHGLSKVAE